MKEQEKIYVKVPVGEEMIPETDEQVFAVLHNQGSVISTSAAYVNNRKEKFSHYLKPLTALVFTPEEFEKLAGEIWEAALLRAEHEYMYGEHGQTITAPDKDTYISSLTNKKQ